MTTFTLRDWVGSLDVEALERLLRSRPDLLRPAPRSLTDLTARLANPYASVAAIRDRPLPCLQLLEALVALGGSAREEVLIGFLDSDGQDESKHARVASTWIDQLQAAGLLRRTETATVIGVDGLTDLFPSPLGLGTPMRLAIPTISVDVLRRMLRAMGIDELPAKRVDLVAEVLAFLNDADRVRALIATAPNSVAAELHELSNTNNPADRYLFSDNITGDDDYQDGTDYSEIADDGYDSHSYSEYSNDQYGDYRYREDEPFRIDPAGFARRRDATDWARTHGLAVSAEWGFDSELTAEVALALRGPDYRAPFNPSPPVVSARVVDSDRLDSHAAAAVSEFASTVLAVLDRLGGGTLPALKSGGVGARELTKLAKAVGCTEFQLRLVLQLCRSAQLIDYRAGAWFVSADTPAWRAALPSHQIASLLQHWLELAHLATQSRGPDGKAMAVLVTRACEGCSMAKHSILEMAGTLPISTVPAAPDQLAQLALWNRPLAHISGAESPVPFAAVLAEATALGIIADGGLTSLGRALVHHQHKVLIAALDAVLPASATMATFGADLTVVVVGAPSLQLSQLLDSSADRESSGGAIVWRFSPTSVRRAFDQGATAEQLARELSDIAVTGLPQPLRYLIDDVGRRHGNLVVSSALSVICSDDQAVLAGAVHDRSLRKIGLRLVAPTVAVATIPVDQALSALRAAGYLPIPDSAEATGVVQIAAHQGPSNAVVGTRSTLDARVDQPAVIDTEALAKHLVWLG